MWGGDCGSAGPREAPLAPLCGGPGRDVSAPRRGRGRWPTGGLCSSAGFSFDLSPLTKKDGYKVETEKYDFYINVCAALALGPCSPGSGACQVSKR